TAHASRTAAAARAGASALMDPPRVSIPPTLWLRPAFCQALKEVSAEPHREHRDRPSIDARYRERDVLSRPRGTGDVEQRQIVLGCRDRHHGMAAERFVVDERRVIAGRQEAA